MKNDGLVRRIGTGALIVASMLPYSGCSQDSYSLETRIQNYTQKAVAEGADKEEVEKFWRIYKEPANKEVTERLKVYGKGNVNLREYLEKHPDKELKDIVDGFVSSGIVRDEKNVSRKELELIYKFKDYAEGLDFSFMW